MAQIDFLLSPILKNGEVLSEGTAYFYESGTTTPKTVYGDENLTSPLGTSVSLDSTGTKLCYVGTSYIKVVVKDADDVEVLTYDGISCVSASISGALDEYYKLNGSNLITGPINANGQDITNADDIDAQTFFANHSSSYSPDGDDYFVLGNGAETYRLNVSESNLVIRDNDSLNLIELNDSSLTLNINLTGGIARFNTSVTTPTLNATTGNITNGNISALAVTTSATFGNNVLGSVGPGVAGTDGANVNQVNAVSSSLTSHTSNTSNPHSTTLQLASNSQGNTSWNYSSNGDQTWLGSDTGVLKTYNLLVKGETQIKQNLSRMDSGGTVKYWTMSVINDDRLYLISDNASYVMQCETSKKIQYSGSPTINDNNDLTNKLYVDNAVGASSGLAPYESSDLSWSGGTPSTATGVTKDFGNFTLTTGTYLAVVNAEHFYDANSQTGTLKFYRDAAVLQTRNIYRAKGGSSGHAYDLVASTTFNVPVVISSDGSYNFSVVADGDCYLQGASLTLFKVAT